MTEEFHFSSKDNYFIDNEVFYNEFDTLSTPSNFRIDFPILAQDSLFIAPQKKSFFKSDVFRIGFVPALFFTASAATWGERENIGKSEIAIYPHLKMVMITTCNMCLR
ncbi:hypothetical protein [Gelidibacter mesophilus]|uniref:hypothetical protein n=1 Tax=Gelidibacter mesophilus TaxID=169050 RepID=UPI0012F922A8|nr:hypothetical protein [Gelidibacter mesophilus]